VASVSARNKYFLVRVDAITVMVNPFKFNACIYLPEHFVHPGRPADDRVFTTQYGCYSLSLCWYQFGCDVAAANIFSQCCGYALFESCKEWVVAHGAACLSV
jgi:hypothetical protein